MTQKQKDKMRKMLKEFRILCDTDQHEDWRVEMAKCRLECFIRAQCGDGVKR